MNERRYLTLELISVLAFCALLFVYGPGSFGLVGADEPRYAQIAREMLARHDWITPVLNGVPWLEKPVLFYWSAMVSYSIFGVHDWAARVPTALMTIGMVFAAYFFMRRFRQGAQLDTALIMASCAGVIGFARAASTDMPLTAMFSIGMLAWFAWFQTSEKRWLCVFYVFLALATLAKGPVAPFLAALIIAVFVFLRRDWKTIRESLWTPGILLYLAVALPWFVLVQRANPQFIRVFIFEHNLARYSSDMFRHKQPFWYFVPVVIVAVLPWVLFVAAALVKAARDYTSDSFQLFFALWAILPVIFFSFSQSKLPGYILPAIPPLAILAAEYIRRREEESGPPRMWFIAFHALIGGVLLGGALLTNYFVLRLKPSPTAITIAIVAGTVCFTGMIFAVYARGARVLRLTTMVPVLLGIVFVIKYASPTIDIKSSSRPIAAKLSALPQATGKVAVFGVPRDIEYGLNFYENAPIASYDRGEIPAEAHLLVAREGTSQSLQMILGKRLSPVGEFSARNLEFYFVSAK